jgi:hypothetical protein
LAKNLLKITFLNIAQAVARGKVWQKVQEIPTLTLMQGKLKTRFDQSLFFHTIWHIGSRCMQV